MKKIAVFSYLPHQYIGGTETYCRELFPLLQKLGYEVHDFYRISPKEFQKPVTKAIEGVVQIDLSSIIYDYPFKMNKKMKEVAKSNEFDIVINNTSMCNNKLLKKNNLIQVQHLSPERYLKFGSKKFFYWLNKTFLRLDTDKNVLAHANTTVFYTKFDNDINKANAHYIPLFLDKKYIFTKRTKEGKNIFWFARHNNHQKGINHFNNIKKIAGIEDEKYVVAGEGVDTHMFDIAPTSKVGLLNSKGIEKELLKSKVTIITSNFEGFCFTICESLGYGTPVVVFDCFKAIRFFENHPGVTIIKKGDYQGFANAINHYYNLPEDEWLNISKMCTDFARKNLSVENFKKSWTKLIQSF